MVVGGALLMATIYPTQYGCRNGIIESGNILTNYGVGYSSGIDWLDTFALNLGTIYDNIIKGIEDIWINNYFDAGYKWGNTIYLTFYKA